MTIRWTRRALAFANKMQNRISFFFPVFSLQSPTLKPALELQVIAPPENFHTSELRYAQTNHVTLNKKKVPDDHLVLPVVSRS